MIVAEGGGRRGPPGKATRDAAGRQWDGSTEARKHAVGGSAVGQGMTRSGMTRRRNGGGAKGATATAEVDEQGAEMGKESGRSSVRRGNLMLARLERLSRSVGSPDLGAHKPASSHGHGKIQPDLFIALH